jgi:hypothetical protein
LSWVQVVKHAVLPQANGVQAFTTGVGQVTAAPPQTPARVSWPPLHEAALHVVVLSN